MKLSWISSAIVTGACLTSLVAGGRFQDVAHRKGFTEQMVKRENEGMKLPKRASTNHTRFLNNNTQRMLFTIP